MYNMGDAASDQQAAIQNYVATVLFPQVLGRAGLPAGIAFWTNAAVSNAWTPAQLQAAFIAGAQPEQAQQAWITQQLASLQPNIGNMVYWDMYAINNNLTPGAALLQAMEAGQQQAIAQQGGATTTAALVAGTVPTTAAGVTVPSSLSSFFSGMSTTELALLGVGAFLILR